MNSSTSEMRNPAFSVLNTNSYKIKRPYKGSGCSVCCSWKVKVHRALYVQYTTSTLLLLVFLLVLFSADSIKWSEEYLGKCQQLVWPQSWLHVWSHASRMITEEMGGRGREGGLCQSRRQQSRRSQLCNTTNVRPSHKMRPSQLSLLLDAIFLLHQLK